MLETLSGISIEIRLRQSAKASPPMLVTPLGRVIEVKLLQSWKTPRFILVNFEFLGMLMDVRLLQC